MELIINTNSNDFNPLYTVVDLDAIKQEKRELNVSKDEAERKGYKIIRPGTFPHMVVCEIFTEIQGSGWVRTFRSLKAANKFKKQHETIQNTNRSN